MANIRNLQMFKLLVCVFCYPVLCATDMSFFTLGPIKDVLQKGRQLFVDQGAKDVVKSGIVPYHSNLAVRFGQLDREKFIMLGPYAQVMIVTCKNILENYVGEAPIDAREFIRQIKQSGYIHVADRTDIRQMGIDFLNPDKMAEKLQSGYQKDLLKEEIITQDFELELQDFANIVAAADAGELLTNRTIFDISLLVFPENYGDNLKVHYLDFKIGGYDRSQKFINGTFYSIQFEPNEVAITAEKPELFQEPVLSMLNHMPLKKRE